MHYFDISRTTQSVMEYKTLNICVYMFWSKVTLQALGVLLTIGI